MNLLYSTDTVSTQYTVLVYTALEYCRPTCQFTVQGDQLKTRPVIKIFEMVILTQYFEFEPHILTSSRTNMRKNFYLIFFKNFQKYNGHIFKFKKCNGCFVCRALGLAHRLLCLGFLLRVVYSFTQKTL